MGVAADVVITMGCGEACPVFSGKRYEDAAVDDPAGHDVETVRHIVDDIDAPSDRFRCRTSSRRLGYPPSQKLTDL